MRYCQSLALAFVALFSFVSCEVHGRTCFQDNESDSEYPSVNEIIERCVEVVGGYEAIDSIQSVRKTATETSDRNANAVFEMHFRSDGFFKETYTYPTGRVYTRIVRDGVGWEGYQDVPARYYHGKELDGYLFRYRSFFKCTHWVDDCESIEFAGLESVEDMDTYKLRMKFKAGYQYDFYFDVESGQLVQSTTDMFYRGKTNTITSTVLETCRVNGILMTKKLRVTRAGRSWIYEYDEIEFDENIPLDIFDYPQGMTKEKIEEQNKKAAAAEKAIEPGIVIGVKFPPPPRLVKPKR
ncbi:MAG: hypothetical protein AB8B55_08060 [Mariniblastus sp.]